MHRRILIFTLAFLSPMIGFSQTPQGPSQQDIAEQQRFEKDAITFVLQARAKNTAHAH